MVELVSAPPPAAPSSDALLDALDPEQRIVAEAMHGAVCVLAGAGTGKTRAITHRIAYGVATGSYDPARVMALTFTSRSAAELRGRLHDLGAGGVHARTFHAAALAQLNYFWPTVVGGSAPRVLEFKGRLLGQAAERAKLRIDTPTLRDVAAQIEWRKVTLMGMPAFTEHLHARGTPGDLDVEQMLELVAAYEDLKDERRSLDFEDVLLTISGMIETEASVAMHVRENYRHFVVDEYQDVSPAQQHLLDLWLGGRNELCVVGDASQTIYSFAGASSRYLLDFEHRFEHATVVRLERNYRSSGPIVGFANQLMRGRPGALRLETADEHRSADAATDAPPGSARVRVRTPTAASVVEPVVTAYPDDLAEARGVASRIRERVAQGTAPETIAVLLRVNSQSAMFEQAIEDVGIGVRMRGGQRFWERPEAREAVHTLRAAALSVSGEPLFKSVSDVLRSIGWSVEPPAGPGAIRARWESLNAIARLVDDVPHDMTFRQFADNLRSRAEAQHEPPMRAVTLATLHSAKGLEWNEVFIVGLTEGMLPIAYATSFDAIDEERRLLYVGITRARERLELSWAEVSGPRRGERQPSRFLQEFGSRSGGAPPPRRAGVSNHAR